MKSTTGDNAFNARMEPSSLLEFIRAIGKRPQFYISDPSQNRVSIWQFKNFIAGFQCGRAGLPVMEDDLILDSLTFWVCTRYKVHMGAMDWAGHLWWQCDEDGEAALKLFFDLFEEYLIDRKHLGPDAIKARFMQVQPQIE